MNLETALISNTHLANIVLQNINPSVIINLGLKKAHKVFQETLKLEGYKKFLKDNNYSTDLNHFKGLEYLPIMDKVNYIKKYPLDEILKYPVIENYTIEQSSGFSGTPFYWLRYTSQDDTFTPYMKLGLEKMFNIQKKSTLLINCFALGTWVTGVKFARFATQLANEKDLKLTVVNTGTVKEDVINVFERFSQYYDQVILVGYPPMITVVIESLIKSKAKDISKVNLIVGGESFPEEWRDYIASLLNINITDFDRKILSAFGSADTGLEIGYEHPITILLRRLLKDDKNLRNEVLGFETDYVPHFFQYNPLDIWIENQNSELLFTVDSGIPIVRYNLHDVGGTISYDKAISILGNKYDIHKLAKELKPFHLPFCYVLGRSDGTISIDGENIYIQDIQAVLNKKSEIYELLKREFRDITEVEDLIPHNEIATKIFQKCNFILNLDRNVNLINSFKLSGKNNRIELFIELDLGVLFSDEQKGQLEVGLYKALSILFYTNIKSYKTLINENLKSADIIIKVCNYSESVFRESHSKIKMNYLIK